MESLTLLSATPNVLSIQKCLLPNDCIDFLKGYKVGLYARLQISCSSHCICKIYWTNDLHSAFAEVDESVMCFRNCAKSSLGFPAESLTRTTKKLDLKQIEFVPCVSVKDVKVSLIFESVALRRTWEEISDVICDLVKEILKLYVVTNTSVVYLKNLKPLQRRGIHCVVVHDIGHNNAAGRITSSTNVHVVNELSKAWIEQVGKPGFAIRLGGLEGPRQVLMEILEHNKKCNTAVRPCRQVLLVGPSGCGKTTLVHQVARESGSVLVSLLGSEVYQAQPGDTEASLRQVFEETEYLAAEGVKCGGVCVLLLDEVDSLCPKRGASGALSSHQARVSAQILSLLEHADQVPALVVVATTNRPGALDSALRRPGRLETEVHIGVPSEKEREEILCTLFSGQHKHLCREVARITPGYVGADLVMLYSNVLMTRRRRSDVDETREGWLSDFRAESASVRPSSLRGRVGVVDTSRLSGLSEIGGMDEMKHSLRAAVEWPLLYPEKFSKFALPNIKGVLLFGPPGCAKTSLVRALASSLNVTFLSVSAAQLYSPYVGDAEKSIGELFHLARLGAPTILFIDEIDALVGSRGQTRERGVQERVLSALLTEMDGIGVRLDSYVTQPSSCPQINSGVMVIAATNRPDMLDDALVRPGRFDKLLYVPPPSAESRLEILQLLTAKMPLADNVDLTSLAQRTQLFSGADLRNLCREAALQALTEVGMEVTHVTQEHFTHVLQFMRPSLTQQQVDWYSNYKK